MMYLVTIPSPPQTQLSSVRLELESCRSRLGAAEAAASERGAAADRAASLHCEARDQARTAHSELQLLRVRCLYMHTIQHTEI